MIPSDLLEPSAGWLGLPPKTDGEWAAAAQAEIEGREKSNRKLEAVGEIVDNFNASE